MGNSFAKNNLVRSTGFADGIETITEIVNVGIIAVSSIQDIVTDASYNRVITFTGVNCVVTAVSVNDIVIIRSVNSIICIGLLQR